MLFEIVNVVLIALLVLLVLLIVDWVFGIDKINNIVSDFLDKHTDAEIVAPFIGLMLLCELGMILYWITGNTIMQTAYLAIGSLWLIFGALLISLLVIGKGLYSVRQYFLGRKKV